MAYQPSDPMYERFGSLEFTDGALEECGEIRFEAFDILKLVLVDIKTMNLVLERQYF